MSKPNLSDAIKTAWKDAVPEGEFVHERPPHLQSIENEARRLDAILSERINPAILQYQDGLISAIELIDMLMYEGYGRNNY